MYQAFGLLLPDSPFALADAARQLAVKLPTFTLKQSEEQLTLLREDWEIHLTLEEGSQVLADSQRIAEHISGNVDELGIRRCRRRIVVSSDVPDPEMEHFGDYLKVIEVMQSFPGLIAVDPAEPSLL